jgi:hypothetical protein
VEDLPKIYNVAQLLSLASISRHVTSGTHRDHTSIHVGSGASGGKVCKKTGGVTPCSCTWTPCDHCWQSGSNRGTAIGEAPTVLSLCTWTSTECHGRFWVALSLKGGNAMGPCYHMGSMWPMGYPCAVYSSDVHCKTPYSRVGTRQF